MGEVIRPYCFARLLQRGRARISGPQATCCGFCFRGIPRVQPVGGTNSEDAESKAGKRRRTQTGSPKETSRWNQRLLALKIASLYSKHKPGTHGAHTSLLRFAHPAPRSVTLKLFRLA